MSDARVESVFLRLREEKAAREKMAGVYARCVQRLREGLFQQQRDLIDDPSRFKAALCTRRAGKSTSAIRYMLIVALTVPGANVQFVTLTAKKARKEIWPDLRRHCRAYDIPAEFNETTMTVKIGDSTINLDGCEDSGDPEKYRGSDGGYDLFIVDESKSFSPEMFKDLVYECAGPALADRMGTMLLIGTPGRTLAGAFFEATAEVAFVVETAEDGTKRSNSRPFAERHEEKWDGVDWEWSYHRWYTRDNSAKPHIWLEQLATKKRRGWTDEDPVWKREYCGEWVADDAGFVYRYAAGRNDWYDDEQGNEYGLPSEHEWRYLLGCDLGFDDPFAIVIVAWSETSPDFYFVDEYTMSGLDITSCADKIEEFKNKYTPDVMVGDRGALGKQILAELENRRGLLVLPADKHEKRDYQELLNSDLLSGRAKLRKGMKLGRQMAALQWKADGKTEDKDTTPKDLCDAALYVWRYCYHHYWKPADVKQDRQADSSILQVAQERMAKLSREATRKALMSKEEARLDRLDSGVDEMEDWS